MQKFGTIVRTTRKKLLENDKSYSLRQVSNRIGIGPSYLSKIERGEPVRLSEEKTVALAHELRLNPDYLLALGGKISNDVQKTITERPELFAKIVRDMQSMPDEIIKEKKDYVEMTAILNRLHSIASIGAFHFVEGKDLSFWTSQVPAILGLSPDTAPSMDTIKSILHPTDDDRVWSCDNFEPSTYHNSYQVEFKLPKNNDKTRIVQVWCCVEKDVTTGEKALLGIIQNVTESVLLQKEIGSAKSLLQLQMDKKEHEISAAIKKLNSEVESRKKCQLELRALNKSIALDAQCHKSFVKKHTFQLRSLISRIASETNCTPSTMPNTLPNVLNRILPKIDDLSDFISRTESIVSDKEPVITSRLFYNIIGTFQEDAAANGLSLNCSQAPDDPDTILTDKRRLRQILTAIMELFVQNTKWGTIQLTHTIDTTTTPRLVVSFYAPSTIHPVTQTMFFPEQEMTEHTSQINPVQMVGTLIEALAGEFSITTTTGTDFSITLRFPISLASKDLPPTPEKKISGMTALIVEDDPYSLMYATKIMQDAGFDVDSAKNGSEAIEHLKEKRFSIILLDIQLPDMDGVFITESIRNDANSANQSTPIIAITAHGSSSDHQTFIRTGINKVITKPFDKDRLLYTAIRLCNSPQ